MTSTDRDFLEGAHDGYMALEDPVMHRRRIVFDKRSRTLAIEDYLEMDGDHDVELFFHCAEGSRVVPIAGGVAIERNGQTIRLRWPDHAAGDAAVLEGSVAPIAGWVSRRFDVKQPAPTVVWGARLSGDCILRTEIDC